MPDIPLYIHLLFIFTGLATAVVVVCSVYFSRSEKVKRYTHFTSLAALMWMIFMAALAINHYFEDKISMPPKLAVPIIILLVAIIVLFALPRGRRFIDGLSLETLTWLHTIRIPVEIVLLLLAGVKMIPASMTFEGTNFDIASGLTAPIVAILYFRKKAIGPKFLLAWNIVCLALLINVVVNAVLSLPSPMQQLNFDQPNMAVRYFPYAWLPTFIVPVVLFSHLVAIRVLTRKKALA